MKRFELAFWEELRVLHASSFEEKRVLKESGKKIQYYKVFLRGDTRNRMARPVEPSFTISF
jgi:hypothetical protein